LKPLEKVSSKKEMKRFKVREGHFSTWQVSISHKGMLYPIRSFYNIDLPGFRQDAKVEAERLCKQLNEGED